MSSETNEINYNDFVDRIILTLNASTDLFPNSIGGDVNAKDLIRQVIKHELPVAQDVTTGLGPPHIFVQVAENPIVNDSQAGRDDRNVKGPRDIELEFWIICVVAEVEFSVSQQRLYNITFAVTQALAKNKTLRDAGGINPLCRELNYTVTPYANIQSTEKTVMARNVVVRPFVPVNLRVV